MDELIWVGNTLLPRGTVILLVFAAVTGTILFWKLVGFLFRLMAEHNNRD